MEPVSPIRRLPAARTWLVLFLISAFTAIAVSTLASYYAPRRADQYQLIHLGWTVHRGGVLYLDAWESKPPGLPWLVAAAFELTGGWTEAPWLLPPLLALMLCATAWWASRGLLPTGWRIFYAACAGWLISLREFDAPSINPDFFCLAFSFAAATLTMRLLVRDGPEVVAPARDGADDAARNHLGDGGKEMPEEGIGAFQKEWTRPTSARLGALSALLAGLLWSAAAGMKQTGAVGFVVMSIAGLVLAVTGRRRTGPRFPLVALLAGFASGLGAMAWAVAASGAGGEAWAAIVTFNEGLLTWDRFRMGLRLLRFGWNDLAPCHPWLGCAAPALLALLSGGTALRERITVAALAAWWLLELQLAMMGPSQTMRYLQGTWAPMLCLMLPALARLRAAWLAATPAGRGVWSVMMILPLLAWLPETGRSLMRGWSEGFAPMLGGEESDRERLRAVGSWIQAHTAPDDAIYVLDYDSGIYLYGARRATSRFTCNRSTMQAEEVLQDLQARPPALILLARPPEVACREWGDNRAERCIELLSHYEEAARIGDYTILAPRAANPP